MDVARLVEELEAAVAAGDWRRTLVLGHELDELVPEMMHAAIEQGRAEHATETEMAKLLEVRRQTLRKRFPPGGPRAAGRPPGDRDEEAQ
jgi:hypothetical protein